MRESTLILVELLKCDESISDQEKLILLIYWKLKPFSRIGSDEEAFNIELRPGRDCFQNDLQLELKAGVIITMATKIAGIPQSVYRLATGWTTKGSEFESRWGKEFSLLHVFQKGCWANPASYPMCTGGSFPGVKRQGREVDHSPPTSAEVKKTWVYTSTPPYVFMA
jgi:hypothetical protein